jgi:hypothetical protein
VGGYGDLGGQFTSDPDATLNLTGGLDVCGQGTDGQLYRNYQTGADGNWSGWSSIGAPPGGLAKDGGPGCALQANGQIAVVVRGSDNQLWMRGQLWLPPFLNTWAPWLALGGQLASDPDATRNSAGGLEVYGRGTDGQLYRNYQTGLGSSWSGWSSIGAPPVGLAEDGGPGCTVATNGQVVVFARGSDDQIWQRAQQWLPVPSLPDWENWVPLGGELTSDPDATLNADGGLVVFAQTGKTEETDGFLSHRWQYYVPDRVSPVPTEIPVPNPYPVFMRRDLAAGVTAPFIGRVGEVPGRTITDVTLVVTNTVASITEATVKHVGNSGETRLTPGVPTHDFDGQRLTGTWEAAVVGRNLGETGVGLNLRWERSP